MRDQLRIVAVVMAIVVATNLATAAGIYFVLPEVVGPYLAAAVGKSFGLLLVVLALGWGAVWLLVRRLFRPIAFVSEGVARLGNGDLTLAADGLQGDAYGQMAGTFNETIAKLRAMVGAVRSEAEEISTSSVSLAAVTTEAKHAVENIAQSTVEIAGGAHEIGKIAQEAAGGTDKVEELVRTTADRMRVIAQSTEAIGGAAGAGMTEIQEATAAIKIGRAHV